MPERNYGGYISTVNSTSIPLGIDGVFTGVSEDTEFFGVIGIQVFSDKASATNGLSVEFSTDGINWDVTDTNTVALNTGITYNFPCIAKYFRVVYTNGGTAQTEFRLQTSLKQINVYSNGSSSGGSSDVTATITGVDDDGHTHNVAVTHDGNLETLDNSNIFSIAQGNVTGVTIINAMGEWEAGTVNSDGEDCCRWADVSGPSRLPTPSLSGEQMSIVSSNNADNGATATGVIMVRINYLDADGNEQAENVTLNGTTSVDTMATNIRFINDFYTLTVGSNGVSEGNISIYKKGGTIGNDLYNLIARGGNKSLVPHRMIPLNKTLYLQAWHAEEAQDKRSAIRIRSTDMHGELISGVFCFKDTVYMRKATSGEISLHGIKIPALSIVKITHWDDQSGTEGSCGWWGYLVDNT